MFNETVLKRYDDCIPYSEIKDYSIFGCLSWDFIFTHLQKFSFDDFCSTAILKISVDQLSELYHYYAKQEAPKRYIYRDVYEEDIIRQMLNNPNFEWSGMLIKQAAILQPYITLCECIYNKHLNSLFTTIPCYLEFYDNLIKREKDNCYDMINNNKNIGYYERESLKDEIKMYSEYWLRFSNYGKIPDNAYKEYFTIDNIKANKIEWETITDKIGHSIRNRWDAVYFEYKKFNKWDRFANNMSIKLTCKLCEFLNSITIRIGGSYITEDGRIVEDYRLQEHNALEVFCTHSFVNEEEMDLVVGNPDLLEQFMQKSKETDVPLVNFLIDDFFKDFSIDDYLYIVNRLSDN